VNKPIELTLTGTAQASQTQTYTHLPFDVPAGTARIDVRYEYTDAVGSDPHLTDGNTVDIGIFDSRGADFMTDGFRGWSGSARQSFFIAAGEATPGYVAGRILPGTWFLCLGLYKIAPQGCQYRVTITLTAGDDTSNVQFPALLPLRSKPGRANPDAWYCGEVHCHTYHSDGDSDPLEVVRLAESLGLDFLAITDHNVSSHLARLNTIETPLMLIPGFEVTTFKGHWNVWGDHGWIDFRIEDRAHMAQAVAEASRRGYLASCNHPRPYGPDWVYGDVDDFDCIEVWNGDWMFNNEVALEFWESRLRTGKRYTAVGGSDCHFLKRDHPAKLAHPTLWIYCPGEPSPSRLLGAMSAGHVFITESPKGAQLTLNAGEAMMGDAVARPAGDGLRVTVWVRGGAGGKLQLHTAAGCIWQESVLEDDYLLETDVDVTGTPYIRAQLVDDSQLVMRVRALTNPIYVD
jgi:hypothetical protein